MDGVAQLPVPTFVLALTNRRELIDEAVLRPGRLEVLPPLGTPTLTLTLTRTPTPTTPHPTADDAPLTPLPFLPSLRYRCSAPRTPLPFCPAYATSVLTRCTWRWVDPTPRAALPSCRSTPRRCAPPAGSRSRLAAAATTRVARKAARSASRWATRRTVRRPKLSLTLALTLPPGPFPLALPSGSGPDPDPDPDP